MFQQRIVVLLYCCCGLSLLWFLFLQPVMLAHMHACIHALQRPIVRVPVYDPCHTHGISCRSRTHAYTRCRYIPVNTAPCVAFTLSSRTAKVLHNLWLKHSQLTSRAPPLKARMNAPGVQNAKMMPSSAAHPWTFDAFATMVAECMPM